MNKSIIAALIFSCALSCSSERPKSGPVVSPAEQNLQSHIYLPDNKTAGDFDGDKKTDSLKQILINNKTGATINGFPTGMGTDAETMQDYLRENDIQLTLQLKDKSIPALKLGAAFDLLALINLGDVNGDFAEDIAVVVDYPDESAVNIISIYSLCSGKWFEMKRINIHESSFVGDDIVTPLQSGVDEFLEKKDGIWMYRDYMEQLENDELPFKKLDLMKCSEVNP